MPDALSYDFLALLPFGVILSSPDGHLVHANPLARHLLARHQPLGVAADGRLTAEQGQASRRLRDAIRAVTGGDTARVVWQGALTQGPHQPVVVRSMPGGDDGAAPLAAIFVADPRSLPRESTLQELHGLTPAEARVALEMLQGHAIAEAARRLGTSPNTVKTQLQRVFEKLQVSRQTELVRLLMDPVGNL
ncbi:MAG TPA: helix-turn-helix transcriptional regulator [Vicinamibacteria bacterium]|nr:helix-turn-helix transcriptional regulator [Vicinamibacteria bacterium]